MKTNRLITLLALMAGTCAGGMNLVYGQILPESALKEPVEEKTWVPSAPGSLIYIEKPTKVYPKVAHYIQKTAVMVVDRGDYMLTPSVGTTTNMGTYHNPEDGVKLTEGTVINDGGITNDGNVAVMLMDLESGDVIKLEPGQVFIVAPEMWEKDDVTYLVAADPTPAPSTTPTAPPPPPPPPAPTPVPGTSPPASVRPILTPYVRGCICKCGSDTVFLPGLPQNQRCGMDGDNCVNSTGTARLTECASGWGPGVPQPATP